MAKSKFSSIEDAIIAVKRGEIVILVDDENRENEGDFCVAAEFATPEAINFMATHGRGLICLAITPEQTDRLNLSLMTGSNKSKFHTNFTVSIEATKSVTTGISVFDRATTIKAAINPNAKPSDIVSPGHVFPLIAKAGGVLQRAGQTEGSVDLMRLAGLNPAGVICEVLAEDGRSASLPQLEKVAEEHKLLIVTVKDLIQYRVSRETNVKIVAYAKLPTEFGDFNVHAIKNTLTSEECIALSMGDIEGQSAPVLCRVHSQCLTGDVFHSFRCDCQPQLAKALQMINSEGRGILLYLFQEGRGIGIVNKIKAYNLQEQGRDTVQANLELGFPDDLREYGFGAQALRILGARDLRLMTNNPRKIVAIEGFGLKVVERVKIEIEPNINNGNYLQTKKSKLGHLLEL